MNIPTKPGLFFAVRRAAFSLVMLAEIASGAAFAAAAPAAAIQPFQADPAAAHIAAAGKPLRVAGQFTLRIPAGWTLSSKPPPSGVPGQKAYTFTRTNANGSKPTFFIVAAPLPPSIRGQENALIDYTIGQTFPLIQKQWVSVHATPTAHGTLLGGPCGAVVYTGTMRFAPGSSRVDAATALFYIACIGNTLFTATVRDNAPDSAKSIPIAQAAILGLTRQ